MINKSGDVCYRSKISQCQKCVNFIKDPYMCWYYNMIPFRVWENIVGYECGKFKSILTKQCNSHYIFPDFENRDRFPEKKFGGIHRFNSKGEIIGKL